jgi:3-oxoacyl-[acyl-carrier protein] reductase
MVVKSARLEGCAAIVTGGARGIGREIALTFVEEGASIAIVDINEKDLEHTYQEIKDRGGTGIMSRVDIARSKEIKRFVELVMEQYGKIDILVNNAAYLKYAPFLDFEEDEWDRLIEVDLKGYFLFSQAVAREMVKKHRGKIISMASIGGEIGFSGSCAYASAKAGVIGLTKVMAVELAPYGISANAISPGPTESAALLSTFDEGSKKARIDRIPCGRLGSTKDIARAAIFLASDDSSYITGHVLHVDGGFLAAGIISPRPAS